jgi:hypothetical protein
MPTVIVFQPESLPRIGQKGAYEIKVGEKAWKG